MASLIIPEQIKKGLLQIASLSEEQLQELYSALENLPLRIKQKGIFDDAGMELTTISSDEFRSIKETLFPLYLSQQNTNVAPSTYARDLTQSLKEQEEGSEWVRSEETIGKLRERLDHLLSIDRAKLVAKTNDVLTEHARTYSKARVFSDIRPVFGESIESPPQVAVIVHMLKINYIKDRERREFVVALDTKDIQQLIDTLERAKSKSESLKSIISSANMTPVDVV